MTGNHADLETSRRLAEAWPLGADDRRHLRWLRRPSDDEGPAGEWWLTEGREASNYLAWGYESIPARDLSELEAKIREMDLGCSLDLREGSWDVTLYGHYHGERDAWEIVGSCEEADTITDALSAAVAQALEAAAKEKSCKKQK